MSMCRCDVVQDKNKLTIFPFSIEIDLKLVFVTSIIAIISMLLHVVFKSKKKQDAPKF